MRKISILWRTLTARKVWNMFLLACSFQLARLTRKPIHWGNPAKIGVEPTTSCNLRCPECPSGLRSFTRPTGMLDMASFREMTDSLCKDLVYMLIYFQGEPYLNPNFLAMASYAAQRGIYVGTSTNGHYLTDSIAKATVESGLHEVIVSIDGATQSTYQQYRIGGSLEKVKEGTRRLVEWRQRLQSRTPHIILQFLVTGANEQEVDEVKALGGELGVDRVVFKTAQIYDFENGHPLIPQDERFSRYKKGREGKYILKNKLRNQCWKLWMGAEMTWDGRILPCCFDKDAQYEMGKLSEASFRSIWRGAGYVDFRSRLVRSRQSIAMCTNCSEGGQIWA